jgi:hypothetical protein
MIQRFRSATMEMKLQYITPLLAAAAAAVVIAAAPTAFAPDQQSCNGSASGAVCPSPGNVQSKTSPPRVQDHPYGDTFYLNTQDLSMALGQAT